jgi:hypothetical protein
MYSSSRFKRGFYLNLQPALAWIAILVFISFSALCLLVGLGKILNLVFPAGALAVGTLLYFRYPILYVGFTWWMWFLSPWVRRLIDFKSGWTDPSPVLLTPYLVTSITFITLVRCLPTAYRQGGLPFILAFAGVFYAFLVGLIKNSFTAAVLGLLSWLSPVLFGFHLFANWRNYPHYRQNIQRTFLWGLLVMGTYGVVQFLVAPAWDQYWMSNAPINSIGTPEPFKIRVYSTMNAPGPFGSVIMAGLILLLNSSGILNLSAAGVGYLAFLLSSSRTAWLGWFVGLLILLTSLKPRIQMRLMVTIVVMAVCVIPLTTMEPFSEVIHTRFQSFSNAKEDASYNARVEGYNQALGEALSETLGKGLGALDEKNYGYSIGLYDSTFLSLLFSLGWFGTIPYSTGLLLILFELLQYSKISFDSFANAARAIGFGIYIQFVLGSVILAVSGVVFWSFLGMAMAARNYYQNQNFVRVNGDNISI